MSDAQSFYLLLAIFYLIECLSSAPSGRQAFVSMGLGNKRWRSRSVAFPVNGFRKDLFFCPFLPWPGMLALPGNQGDDSPISPMALRHLRKRIQILAVMTSALRSMSLVIFLHFFVLLPVIYYFYAKTLVVPLALGYGYLLCAVATVRFYGLHKRLFPSLKDERFKHTIYTLFLPWHAMRSADVIIARRSASWSPVVLLATDPECLSNKRRLRRLWNEAVLQPKAKPGQSELRSLFEQARVDLEKYTAPPEVAGDEVYCPICETVYVEGTEDCANCEGVSLVSSSSKD